MKKIVIKFWFLIFIFLFISKINALDKAVGLKSKFNTCFMNATLQCLFGLNEFNNTLVKNIDKYSDDTISKVYIELFNTYETSKNEINTNQFCEKMWPIIFPSEGKEDQQDAQQLIGDLLYHLTTLDIQENNKQLKEKLSKQIITQLKSTISDTETPKRFQDSISTEKLTNLSVGTFGDKLKNCLNNFFEKEDIEYKPENLSEAITANKQYKISRLPKYLIIHLKRFIYNPETEELDKNNRNISFELNLDLQNYLSDETKNQNSSYNLIGMVEHTGGLDFGHYIAYTKRNKKWYEFDDERATELPNNPPLENMEGSTPYLLFYERTIYTKWEKEKSVLQNTIEKGDLNNKNVFESIKDLITK